MSDVDIEKLRALAEAATPGPWVAVDEGKRSIHPTQVEMCVVSGVPGDQVRIFWNPGSATACDAAFIAAANPQAVLALLSDLDSARRTLSAIQSDSNAALERYRQEVAGLRKECHGRRFDPNLVSQIESLTMQRDQLLADSKTWSCPDCAFTFCAYHTNQDGSLTCPLCDLTEITADRDRLREGLREACDIADSAVVMRATLEEEIDVREHIAALRLLTNHEAKP